MKGFFVDKLVANTPYYVYTTIPGGLYPGNPRPTQTYGVVATVVTSSKVLAEVIYQVVKTVFDNFDEFKKSPMIDSASIVVRVAGRYRPRALTSNTSPATLVPICWSSMTLISDRSARAGQKISATHQSTLQACLDSPHEQSRSLRVGRLFGESLLASAALDR